MDTITAKEYKQNIAWFFNLCNDGVTSAAAKQMADFTREHHAPNGYVYCLEEGGDGWFRMKNEEHAKI